MMELEERHDMRRAFTLIELLVAMAIMVMLMSMLAYIYASSRKIFTECTETTELYQRIRTAFEMLEREWMTVKVMHDMEFFDDAQPWNGHYDEVGDVPGVYGNSERSYGLREHLPGALRNLLKYVASAAIYGNTYTDRSSVRRRADIIYFKSMTTIKGRLREALIMYKIDDGPLSAKPPGLPVLKKYVLYKTDSGSPPYQEEPSDKNGQDICVGVTDMRVDYYYDDPTDSKPPDWLTVKDGKVKEFCYRGWGRILDDGRLTVPDSTGESFDYPDLDQFRQIASGDKMYLYSGYPNEKQNPGLPDDRKWKTVDDGDYRIERIEYENNKPYIVFARKWPGLPTHINRLRFRCGYLPAAIRVTLRIVNRRGRMPRTVSRIIRLRSR